VRIHVDFVMEIPDEDVPALIELAAAKGRAGAREFVQAEAEENILTYLEDHGINPVAVRGKARPS
jgi:hypothetical protein